MPTHGPRSSSTVFLGPRQLPNGRRDRAEQQAVNAERLHVFAMAQAEAASRAWQRSRAECEALKAEISRLRSDISSLSGLTDTDSGETPPIHGAGRSA